MTIKKFYENYKDVMVDKVLILQDNHNVYENFLRDQRPFEFLMDCEVKNIYISDDELIVQVD